MLRMFVAHVAHMLRMLHMLHMLVYGPTKRGPTKRGPTKRGPTTSSKLNKPPNLSLREQGYWSCI